MWTKVKPRRGPAFFPEGLVGYAIGDVHGRSDLLGDLLARIDRDLRPAGHEPVVILLGDYVDRGPDSRGVIGQLLKRGGRSHFLMGNHEQAMLNFLDEPSTMRGWLMHGGMETLASFGVRPCSPEAPDADLETARDALKAAMTPQELGFLQNLERFVVHGDYVFAHAGVDPKKPLDKQTDDDLFWIRQKFLEGTRPYSHVVVHGHTPQAAPSADARRIGLDTGAYATGMLSAVRLEGSDVRFL